MSNSEEILLMLGEKPGAKRLSVQMGRCPSCSRDIKLPGRIIVGMQVRCSTCGDELQVVETDPIELDWLYDYDEFDNDEDW